MPRATCRIRGKDATGLPQAIFAGEGQESHEGKVHAIEQLSEDGFYQRTRILCSSQVTSAAARRLLDRF